jgi:hypothetical protein
MACLVALLVSASPAIASRDEFSNLEPLWKAFPLHPTGERLLKANERPTMGVVEFIPASNRDLGDNFSPTLLCVLFAAVVVPTLLCLNRLRQPKPNDGGSDRLLVFSFIGALVAAETLYGYAIFILVVTLLL